MNDTKFCDQSLDRSGTQVRIGEAPDGSHAVAVPASVASASTPQSRRRRYSVDHYEPLKTYSRESTGQGEREDPAGDAKLLDIDVAAKSLPIDDLVGSLSDTLPADTATIELRLGLRRTRVAGVDMRGRTPTVMEIIEALAPERRVDQ